MAPSSPQRGSHEQAKASPKAQQQSWFSSLRGPRRVVERNHTGSKASSPNPQNYGLDDDSGTLQPPMVRQLAVSSLGSPLAPLDLMTTPRDREREETYPQFLTNAARCDTDAGDPERSKGREDRVFRPPEIPRRQSSSASNHVNSPEIPSMPSSSASSHVYPPQPDGKHFSMTTRHVRGSRMSISAALRSTKPTESLSISRQLSLRKQATASNSTAPNIVIDPVDSEGGSCPPGNDRNAPLRKRKSGEARLPRASRGKSGTVEAPDLGNENATNLTKEPAEAKMMYSPSFTDRHFPPLPLIRESLVKRVYDMAESKTPATPKRQNRTGAVSRKLLPRKSLEFLDTIAPPISRNPLASPLLNKLDAFGVASPTSTSRESVDSPLMPPTTQSKAPKPTALERESSSGKDVGTSAGPQNTVHYITTKPTCSLNLVCYRSGTRGCELHQIQTVKRSRFKDEAAFQKALTEDPKLIVTDEQFFRALQNVYLGKMCNFWRRIFFLKTLRGMRLLAFTPTSRPTIVPLDDFVLQEVLFAYTNPSKIDTEHVWIDWVFRLRQPDQRHALEFVEGWNGTRIAITGTIPWLFSTLVGIIWSVRGGDVQTAFTVAGFILTSGTLVLALLAVISGIEASGRASA